jgi:DNA-binding MarR family transcriptional regulator
MRKHIDKNIHVNKRSLYNPRKKTYDLLSVIDEIADCTTDHLVNYFNNPNYYKALLYGQVRSLIKEGYVKKNKIAGQRSVIFSITEKGANKLEWYYETLTVQEIRTMEHQKKGVFTYYIREFPTRNELKLLYNHKLITVEDMDKLNTDNFTYLVFSNIPGTIPRVFSERQPKVLNEITYNFKVLREITNG